MVVNFIWNMTWDYCETFRAVLLAAPPQALKIRWILCRHWLDSLPETNHFHKSFEKLYVFLGPNLGSWYHVLFIPLSNTWYFWIQYLSLASITNGSLHCTFSNGRKERSSSPWPGRLKCSPTPVSRLLATAPRCSVHLFFGAFIFPQLCSIDFGDQSVHAAEAGKSKPHSNPHWMLMQEAVLRVKEHKVLLIPLRVYSLYR